MCKFYNLAKYGRIAETTNARVERKAGDRKCAGIGWSTTWCHMTSGEQPALRVWGYCAIHTQRISRLYLHWRCRHTLLWRRARHQSNWIIESVHTCISLPQRKALTYMYTNRQLAYQTHTHHSLTTWLQSLVDSMCSLQWVWQVMRQSTENSIA